MAPLRMKTWALFHGRQATSACCMPYFALLAPDSRQTAAEHPLQAKQRLLLLALPPQQLQLAEQGRQMLQRSLTAMAIWRSRARWTWTRSWRCVLLKGQIAEQ